MNIGSTTHYKALLYDFGDATAKAACKALILENGLIVYDEIYDQLKELIKTKHPKIKLKDADYEVLIPQHLNGVPLEDYGMWAYYPWSGRLVHVLGESEFIDVRTNRNKYKITEEESKLLATKKIGIIGLSVGQSIALTMAMERICGQLRIADFDTAELSNLNRLRTGVHNLGLKKTLIAAREISEIDPYLDVQVFSEGLTEDNMDDYFTKDGKIDILVEVCDGLDIKIVSRYKARELGIPVVMDTNDRGMLDVERFDLEPGRPVLHGLADGLDPSKIKGLTNEEKIPYILKMIGAETLSMRLKASMMEVEQSINTWPQLASSVTLGGALTTDVCRRILLNQYNDSGRYYLDFDELIYDKSKEEEPGHKKEYDGPDELTPADLTGIAAKYSAASPSRSIDDEQLNEIIKAACAAPSGGNAQPWKFSYHDNRIFIFHDAHFSYSLLDVNDLGSYLGFGAMLENIGIAAAALGIATQEDVAPLKDDSRLIAVVSFTNKTPDNAFSYLSPAIDARVTNRNTGTKQPLEENDKQGLAAIAATIPGGQLHLFDTSEEIAAFTDILTSAERLRFMNPRGHYDTFIKELRFTQEEIESTADGLDLDTLNMSNGDKAALQVARSPAAIGFLHQMEKGEGFKKISAKGILSASAIGVISMNGHDAQHFLQGGRAVERVWLEANQRNISFQPIAQLVFLLERYMSDSTADFNNYEMQELGKIKKALSDLTHFPEDRYPVFTFRLFYGDGPKKRSLRRGLDKVLFVD